MEQKQRQKLWKLLMQVDVETSLLLFGWFHFPQLTFSCQSLLCSPFCQQFCIRWPYGPFADRMDGRWERFFCFRTFKLSLWLDGSGSVSWSRFTETLSLFTLKWGKLWVFRFLKGEKSNWKTRRNSSPVHKESWLKLWVVIVYIIAGLWWSWDLSAQAEVGLCICRGSWVLRQQWGIAFISSFFKKRQKYRNKYYPTATFPCQESLESQDSHITSPLWTCHLFLLS